jgi:hypothetical protein
MSQNFQPIGHEDHRILRNEKDEHGIWRQVCSCGKRLTLADYPAMSYVKLDTSVKIKEENVKEDPFWLMFPEETREKAKVLAERLTKGYEEVLEDIARGGCNDLKRLYEEELTKAPMFKTGYYCSPLPYRYLIINMNDI